MYQNIVVGTDGSERATMAVEHAAALARLCGGRLHLVQGCGSPVMSVPMYGDAVPVDHHEVVQACEAELEPLAARIRTTGVEVDLHVVSASGHSAVCDVADTIDADLIVIGNRGMTGARRLLGSVPTSITHHAQCSVLIVHTD